LRPDSFYEYYGLALPARRSVLSHEELMKLVRLTALFWDGFGKRTFISEEKARCAVMAYDSQSLPEPRGIPATAKQITL
jgi:hypothetical protein